ncbi:MAG TPA: hypothetical protein VFX89_18930 [Gammaproteobacteria bacterium]|nr:hypothetical protein [Gammaproteobacteria bacterium]
MEILDNLPPAVTLVIALLLLAWLVLLLLVPFMIESIRSSTRKSYYELVELNKKMERLIVMLAQRDAELRSERADFDLFESRPASDSPPPRSRKEPTISG